MSGYWPENLICLIRGHAWAYLRNEAHVRFCCRCAAKEFCENAWSKHPPDSSHVEIVDGRRFRGVDDFRSPDLPHDQEDS